MGGCYRARATRGALYGTCKGGGRCGRAERLGGQGGRCRHTGRTPLRAYRLVASWDALAYVGPDYKVAMPLGAGGLLEMRISDAHDGPVSEPDTVLAQLSEALADVLRDLSAFFRK